MSNIYKNLKKNKLEVTNAPEFNIHFVNGCFIELLGNNADQYQLDFIKDNEIDYSIALNSNHWAKTNKTYFVDWKIRMTDKNFVSVEYKYDCSGKRVYIALESKSLGDTLAWFPYVDEFRKKHKCDVIVSTFYNDLFIKTYPELNFVEPGDVVSDLYAMYLIGWFYNGDNIDYNRNPNNFRLKPLQQTASDILGLDYVEIKPKLKLKNIKRSRQVAIAIHSTAQAKYWNNLTGWQEVIDFLLKNNYEVVLLSYEHNGFRGNIHPNGIKQIESGNLELIMDELQKSEFFIGIGSGLSWLSWATNTPTFLISGFSEKYTEPITITKRIGTPTDLNLCTGCFNNFKINDDWNWCPRYKETPRQFECTKTITGEMVIDEIKNYFNENYGTFIP